MQIEGYVNAVGRDSRQIPDEYGYPYREQIAPGTFRNALANAQKPVAVLLDHDEKHVIGTDGENVTLSEDTIGLHADATFTDPQVIESARAGELVGWSFGFIPLDKRDEYTENGHRVIVTEMDLREVSLIDSKMTPVYAGTSVHARADGGEDRVHVRTNDGEVVYRVEAEEAKPEQRALPEPIDYTKYETIINSLKK